MILVFYLLMQSGVYQIASQSKNYPLPVMVKFGAAVVFLGCVWFLGFECLREKARSSMLLEKAFRLYWIGVIGACCCWLFGVLIIYFARR